MLDVTAGYPDPLKERNGSEHRQEVPNERADKPVLENVTWLIGAGDRFGLLGENGAGKSTLIDIIQGKLKPLSGRVKIGQTVRFGVLSQQLDELQPLLNDTIREVLSRYKRSYIIDGKETSPEKLLERLGFTQEQLWSRIGDLSGGQRRRLQLMLTLLKEPNVLILDEPGNDLDTDMLAIVEDLLDGWPGTLILVTHDRYLMERVTDQQFALIDGHLRHVPGGVDEYLRLASSAGLSDGQGGSPTFARTIASKPDAKSDGTASTGLSNAERQRLRKEAASLERRMDTQRKRIDELEAQMAAVDPTDYLALETQQRKIDEARAAIDDLETAWLEVSEQLES